MFFAHPSEGGDLIAEQRCFLVAQALGRAVHARDQPFHDLVLFAGQKEFGAVNVLGVIRLAHQADTRGGATLDLVQKTGPRTVREYGVLAGP
ncbi:hypothetical protein D3C83_60640 [compost metagenome]